jgi:hypothetical protein
MAYKVKYYRHGKVVAYPEPKPREKKRPTEDAVLPVKDRLLDMDETELMYLSNGYHGETSPRPVKRHAAAPKYNAYGREIKGAARDLIRSRLALAFDDRFRDRRVCLLYTFTVPHGLGNRIAAEFHPELVRSFQKLLENLRKRHYLKDYFWVSEAQKNGQIHFHCIFFQKADHKLDVRKVNFYWCRLLMEIGVDCMVPTKRREFMIGSGNVDFCRMLCRPQSVAKWHKGVSPFEDGFDKRWLSAVYPCVDAKRIESGKSLGKYLTKYVTKGSDQPVYGCRWYMSSGLVRLKGFVVVDDVLDRMDTYSTWDHIHQWGEGDCQWVKIAYVDADIYSTSEFTDINEAFARLITAAKASDPPSMAG